MSIARRLAAALAIGILPGPAAPAHAEILVRWDHANVPAPESLGITTIAVPAERRDLVRRALARGYRVYLELDVGAVDAFAPPGGSAAGVVVRGRPSPEQRRTLEARLGRVAARVIAVETDGTWPRVRSNLVVRQGEVLQVTGRSAQPWIETNAARATLMRAGHQDAPTLLTYDWVPHAAVGAAPPQLDDYLTAIAEAGSFGTGLLLPLHDSFQQSLAAGEPQARADWEAIRRHLQFYSWELPARYQPVAGIGVVSSDPASWLVVLNLLARHNLPFEPIAPSELSSRELSAFDLIIARDVDAAGLEQLTAYARGGGTLVLADAGSVDPLRPGWRQSEPVEKSEGRVIHAVGSGRVIALRGVENPDTFALDMRRLLGRERRVIDVWNGLTVIAAPFRSPYSSSLLVTAVNYARGTLPIQLRIRGAFTVARFESPDQPAILIPCTHRNGFTEIVVPALRFGGRVFLSHTSPAP